MNPPTLKELIAKATPGHGNDSMIAAMFLPFLHARCSPATMLAVVDALEAVNRAWRFYVNHPDAPIAATARMDVAVGKANAALAALNGESP